MLPGEASASIKKMVGTTTGDLGITDLAWCPKVTVNKASQMMRGLAESHGFTAG